MTRRRLVILVASGLAVLVAVLVMVPPGGGGTRLRVSVASSLTDAFADLAAAYEETHPGTRIELNVAGSATLRDQILEGAPTDVLASANQEIMSQLQAAGLVHDPTVVARNHLTIAVPEGNPAGVTGLTDFGRSDLLIGLCAPQVPCGSLAHQVLDDAGIEAAVDSYEPNVRALLTKVEAGELDAGFVYVTDVLGRTGVESVEFAGAETHLAGYPIAILSETKEAGAAADFVGFVTSAEGSAILQAHGFITP